jgi:hypothetical protein
MVDRMDVMFLGLRAIIEHACALRAAGRLDFLPMGQLVARHEISSSPRR